MHRVCVLRTLVINRVCDATVILSASVQIYQQYAYIAWLTFSPSVTLQSLANILLWGVCNAPKLAIALVPQPCPRLVNCDRAHCIIDL